MVLHTPTKAIPAANHWALTRACNLCGSVAGKIYRTKADATRGKREWRERYPYCCDKTGNRNDRWILNPIHIYEAC